MKALTRTLTDDSATEALGADLARAIQAALPAIEARGLNIRLEGPLGAGKTSLARAALRALGVTGRVRSPTFTLLEPYTVLGLACAHFDFYRFEDPSEFEEAGFRDNFGPGRITLSEWSGRALGCLPAADLEVRLSVLDEGRRADLVACSPLGLGLLDSLGCPR